MSALSAAQAALAELRLAITDQPLANLKPDPKNARRHSKAQVRMLADGMRTFGFVVPILVDRENHVIAGHARLQAAKLLGRAQVPTIRLEHLNPAQITALKIADNRLSELSSWDDQLLGEQLRELTLLNLDFSVELTGFSVGEIDLRIEALETVPAAKPDPADQSPEPAGPAVTVPGDLWLLGEHRLLCGDALEAASYDRLLATDRAAMVFTDPPYNVPIQGHVGGRGAVRHREFAMACGEMTGSEFTAFLGTVCQRLVERSHAGALHYLCMDWRHLPELFAAALPIYGEMKNLCVWAKDNAGMGSFYRSQHELVAVFKHGTAPHRNNVELGRHGRNRSNVWCYPGVNSFGRHGEEGNLLALHPTVKPVKLVADAIMDCTARGEVVLDAFLGSGSTLIAAERVGRRCFALELDPLYVDTAIRRWQAWTGESARHAETGESFAVREASARGDVS